MAKEIKKGDKLTSTSDFTVDNLVDYVAKNLGCGDCRDEIERIIKDVVRPCAIDGKLGVKDAPGIRVGQDGQTGEVTIGLGGKGGCSGCGTVAGRCGWAVPKDGIPAAVVGVHAAADDCVLFRTAPDGASPKLAMTSKWYNTVLQNGEVWTPYTNRRFLPAQYLGLMERYDGNIDKGIACRYALKDAWKLLEYELNNLVFMKKHWRTAFAERSRFLPIETCGRIFDEYLSALEHEINDKGKCSVTRRTGSYWRKIKGEGRVELWKETQKHREGPNGFVSDEKVVEPTKWLVKLNAQIAIARDRIGRIRDYDDALEVLVKHLPKISMGTFKDGDNCTRNWLPKAWKEAFKAQGAYYTLKSLVVNGHVRLATEDGDYRHRETTVSDSARDGLVRLQGLIGQPAYILHAILKKSIDTAGLNVGKFLRRVCR